MHDRIGAETFGWFSLGPWVMMSTPLASYFKNEKAFVAVEGSRKFRSPKGIGLMPFEGCTFIAFAGNLRDRAEQSLTTAALRVEEVEGHRILVFQEKPGADTWTAFAGFAGSNVLQRDGDPLALLGSAKPLSTTGPR
jgi:hypothetical protein